jgi:hypothetical protein
MKKFIYLIPMMLFMTSCGLFEFDNYEDYNAAIKGAFTDEATGDNVQQECLYTFFFGGMISTYTTGYVAAYELGWDIEAAQYWLIKYDGSYVNNCIFAGTYRLEAKQNNFYPVTQDEITIKKGSNTVNWTVTPYVRVIDPVITYDAALHKFKATFKCQYGDNTQANTISKALFCVYTDTYVGASLRNCTTDPEASLTGAAVIADGTTVNTMYIDPALTLAGTVAEFKYSPRTHYFRIAVCATGTGINTSSRYNFSPIVPIEY